MRYQDRIYIQNANANVRNKSILNFGTSSDFCVFNSPTYTMSGGTKILCDEVTCEFSAITMQDYLSAATANCGTGLTQSCVTAINWSTKIYEDNIFAYSADFLTSYLLTGDTALTNVTFVNQINTGLNTLGYPYTKTGDRFDIEKKFGVDELKIDICINYDLTTTFTGCTFTGDCGEFCQTACTETFLGIDSGSTGVHIISTATTIDVTFDFTANTNSFTATNATFKYEVYKYNHLNKLFQNPPLISSGEIAYSTFSATSATTQSLPISTLGLDGEYLVKGYYVHDVCTDFLNRLGERHDTSLFKTGDKFDLYDADKDYYFVAMTEAEIPTFNTIAPAGLAPKLYQQVIIPTSGQTLFGLQNNVEGEIIVALNGLTLAKEYDWVYVDPKVIKLSGITHTTDILTITYTTSLQDTLTTDVIDVTSTIISGVTGGQGSEKVYFNTTESKYELYTQISVINQNQVLVSINGSSLASGVDYYLSSSNNKRIILEGNVLVGDIIIVTYVGATNVINGLTTNTPFITWSIPTAPKNADGRFVIEVADSDTFGSITSTVVTPYVTLQSSYSDNITVTGSVGTNLFYRIKNEKDYISIKGDKIESSAVSETVPITIIVNSLNNY